MANGALIIDLKTCKNSCFFCSDLKRIVPDEEMARITRGLQRDVASLKASGIKTIEISGQDPLEYPLIDSLIRELKNEGFAKVELLTHGRNLCDAELVKRLAAAGLDEARIPI